MFKKVLIAEDHEIANISVQKTLNDLGIVEAQYVYYCDHALTWIRNAIASGKPYDLLITDLVFEDDFLPQSVANGMELAAAAKKIQPNLKIIVLSAESRKVVIDDLFSEGTIDAYVRKARNDAKHLREALEATFKHVPYRSPEPRQLLSERNAYQFTNLDMHIIKLLAEGISQKEMSLYLQQRDIRPSSLSNIEKRLRMLKDAFNCTKNEQLIAYCKEIGIV